MLDSALLGDPFSRIYGEVLLKLDYVDSVPISWGGMHLYALMLGGERGEC